MLKMQIIAMVLCLTAITSWAHGPTRQQTEQNIDIDATPEAVWAVVGNFGALDKWHPAVVGQQNPDENTRILDLGEGKYITEALKSVNDERMMLKYKITDMTVVETFEFAGHTVERKVLPVDTYSSIIKVADNGRGSTVTWTGKFYRAYLLNPPTPEGMDDQTAIDTMTAVYSAGLKSLKAMLEQ